jgi:hypothetical protein
MLKVKVTSEVVTSAVEAGAPVASPALLLLAALPVEPVTAPVVLVPLDAPAGSL